VRGLTADERRLVCIDSALVRRLLPFVLILTFAAGCSTSKPGEQTVRPLPTQVVGTVAQETTTTATVAAKYQHGDPAAGKTIFKTGPCAGCHTLADAGTSGTVGPNLNQVPPPPLSLVVDRLTNGKGAMPSFKGQLSDTQIANVAAYVVKATGGNANG
jgi:mono/diheme cytochrome c family protein